MWSGEFNIKRPLPDDIRRCPNGNHARLLVIDLGVYESTVTTYMR